MISFWRLACLAAFLLLPACGGQDRFVQDGPSQVALWEVTGPRGERGWIFGTVHALPPGVAWQRPALTEALARADRLVLELGAPVDPTEAARVLARLGNTPGLPLPSERVSAQHRATVVRALNELDLDERRLTGKESWAVALQLAGAASARAGATTAGGVEQALRQMSGARPVFGLETLEGQFALFDALPEARQRIMLEQTAAEVVSNGGEDRDLLRLWLAGDEQAIARETGRGLLSDPALREALLVRRNTAWVRQIETMLQSGARPFVAVGAAHVAGGEGLPALLAARGWTVKRLR